MVDERCYVRLREWPKILIADDNADMRSVAEWMAHCLWRDAAIRTAENGALAREMLLELRPDLFITDVRMPGEDGANLCRLARQTPELLHTKILVITGYDQARTREGLLECADGYLAKPFEPKDLGDIAFRLLGSGTGRQMGRLEGVLP